MNIPKKIHLTCKNKNDISNPVWVKCLQKYRSMYPDYQIIIHDNNDIYNIFKEHYPEYLDKIKQIKVGAVLADIFRYLILYLEGGIYSDLDCEPIKRIDDLLDPDFKYYHGDKDRDNNYWIYKTKNQIINKEWDFTYNICNNCKVINNTKIPIHMKCLGHSMGNISTILSYEFHSEFVNIQDVIRKDCAIGNIYHDALKIYNCQICQWFIITEPKQEIFKKTFLSIMEKLDILINLNIKSPTYQHSVINITGPSAFTKVVMGNLTDKIKILPSDFFCCGSWNRSVPMTTNSYTKHHYTGSWK